MIDWPYTEGLRIDEAMHPLTLLAFGMYGDVLPAQNGAPVRVVVPWKYGFKSAKSLVRIRFVESSPRPRGRSPTRPSTASIEREPLGVITRAGAEATERRLGEEGCSRSAGRP